MDHAIDKPPSQRRQRGTLAIVCLATMILCLDIAVANSALPSIARDLHAGLGGVQWVVDAYTLTLAAFVLSAGSIADHRGRRRVFVTGTVLFTGASLACAVSGSILFLDLARAVQGLGAAMMFATALAILAHAFPAPRERAGAMAAFGASIGASFTIGSVVGGGLTSWLGWRSVFYVNVPLGLIALIGTVAWVRESRDPHPHKLDLAGQVTAAAGMFLLVLALVRGNTDGWGSADRGFRDLLDVLRDLPVRHPVPAERAAPLADRRGSDLPPGHDARVHRLRGQRQARRANQPRGVARVRPDHGRRRARPPHDDRRAFVLDGDPPRRTTGLTRDRDLQSHARPPRSQRGTA